MTIVPFSLKDAPSFIEHAFPAQRVSIEAQAERMANAGQTLTGLGSYWKGRKPLVLVRACILGSLLPATNQPAMDLEVFEMLMAMDDAAFEHRAKSVSKADVGAYGGALAHELISHGKWKVVGRERQRLLGQVLSRMPYSMRLDRRSLRPEECPDTIYDLIWKRVNSHLGTSAHSHTELVEQLGIMRFGRRPVVGDTFAGGGSIPFESARLGCSVHASDLNPVACLLTWGAFHIVGGSLESRKTLALAQRALIDAVHRQLETLDVETDGHGWHARAYLYCVEVTCPWTGWSVPLLPSRIVSVDEAAIAELVPVPSEKRYEVRIRTGVSPRELDAARAGTVVRDGKYGEAHLLHHVDGVPYKTNISTLRGDHQRADGTVGSRLRLWDKHDFMPRPEDLFQDRLYCIQWIRPNSAGKGSKSEYRSVSTSDVSRERIVEAYVAEHLAEWQGTGWVPDMQIKVGAPPRYQGLDLIRARGWTHWHHLFNPRQLLVNAALNGASNALLELAVANVIQHNAKLSMWDCSGGGRAGVKNVFSNQALNTLYNYGARSSEYCTQLVAREYKSFPLPTRSSLSVATMPADQVSTLQDIYVTDPPYGDAVKYEEILDFFIAWLRKNPPAPFSDWTWDSRRDLAVKGSGDDFRREMVRAYSAMTQHMPDNGLQIVMFTHQDGGVWADMANIFWGAGLKVTAAWYIATETSSELKKGGYVQGTVILVLRKRMGAEATYTNEVVEEIRQEVARQIETLTGLNQSTRAGRDENLFNDADLQMAGFAAALRVLTHYTHIDDQDMTREALRPRVSGETTLAERIIDHAVQIANEYLVPEGLDAKDWDRLNGSERFYLRMLDVEEAGGKKLDSYQNFAKAFKVRDFGPMMASQKPNDARLKSGLELKKGELSGSELGTSTLRAILFALYELQSDVEPDDVMSHLRDMVPGYMRKRDLVSALARYLALKLAKLRPPEAEAARVLTGLVKNEKVGG